MTKAAGHGDLWDWDCTVALEFAAEALFEASQLLTSDIVPSTQVLSVSYLKCISSLLQHQKLFPVDVARDLRRAQQEYLQRQPPELAKVQCDLLAAKLKIILRNVSDLLIPAAHKIAA